ncbi:helix-turn-helix transcriptional regulator, partial [Nostoc sp. NIES-2111]
AAGPAPAAAAPQSYSAPNKPLSRAPESRKLVVVPLSPQDQIGFMRVPEAQLAEEVGFFVTLPDTASVVVSLMRNRGTGAFPARAVRLLRDLEPLVSALVRNRWSDLAARFSPMAVPADGRMPARVATPGSVWRELTLTTREAAVVELVLQGHSSESIARRLDIATGTVKVHRRNVYRKLGIASQTQLLSIYLDRISGRP